MSDCIFTDNSANGNVGGGVLWRGSNGALTTSKFGGNTAVHWGGGISWNDYKGILTDCTFTDNSANWGGGAVELGVGGSMVDCSFNSKWINNNSKSNGIYAYKELIINGGSGIVDVIISGTLSGISIVVLNNETYYYPPNSNINLTDKQ